MSLASALRVQRIGGFDQLILTPNVAVRGVRCGRHGCWEQQVPIVQPGGNARAGGQGPEGGAGLVGNHQLVSESLGLLLDGQQDMVVVGKAGSVSEAAALPRQLDPDIVVMDFHLGDGTGRDAAIAMREAFPTVRFVFLSRDGGDNARLAAVEAGASAYVLKSSPASEVIVAIRKAAEGATLISPAMIARLVSRGADR